MKNVEQIIEKTLGNVNITWYNNVAEVMTDSREDAERCQNELEANGHSTEPIEAFYDVFYLRIH